MLTVLIKPLARINQGGKRKALPELSAQNMAMQKTFAHSASLHFLRLSMINHPNNALSKLRLLGLVIDREFEVSPESCLDPHSPFVSQAVRRICEDLSLPAVGANGFHQHFYHNPSLCGSIVTTFQEIMDASLRPQAYS